MARGRDAFGLGPAMHTFSLRDGPFTEETSLPRPDGIEHGHV